MIAQDRSRQAGIGNPLLLTPGKSCPSRHSIAYVAIGFVCQLNVTLPFEVRALPWRRNPCRPGQMSSG